MQGRRLLGISEGESSSAEMREEKQKPTCGALNKIQVGFKRGSAWPGILGTIASVSSCLYIGNVESRFTSLNKKLNLSNNFSCFRHDN